MKASITVLGAGQEVGRSSFLVDCGEKILLDHGVKLLERDASGKQAEKIHYPLPIKTNLDAAVIGHAHLDHSGNLPALFSNYHCLTYMTPPTLDLSKMLWFDSLKIAGFEGMDSSYTTKDIERVERYCFPTQYKRRLQITKGTSLELLDAGHILGSAAVKLVLPNKKTLIYTGDFKGAETRLHHGVNWKKQKCDYLLMESTYGNREHPPREELEKKFAEEVRDTLESGGWAIVSAFAVGRSQEMIDILHEYKLSEHVFLDGMSQKASRIYLEYPHYLKDVNFLKKALHKARWVKTNSIREKALKKPSIIVTTSGMLGGGPVMHYIKKLHSSRESKLFLTGFQVPGTPGRRLLEEGIIELDDEVIKPKMQVRHFDFSAHAGHSSLLRAAEELEPEKIVLVHGDKEIAQNFKKELEEKGFEAIAPKNGQTVEL